LKRYFLIATCAILAPKDDPAPKRNLFGIVPGRQSHQNHLLPDLVKPIARGLPVSLKNDMAESEEIEDGYYPLQTLYVYLTDRCNLFCRHCWIQKRSPEHQLTYSFLLLKDLTSIIEQALPLGLTAVKLTGGEPLLHPQIKEVLELLRRKGLDCLIETNGTLCTPEIAALIAAGNNPLVSVSLDGAETETHEWIRRTPGCFQAAMEGLKNLVAAGLRPQIIMTVMRRNQDQLEALVRIGERLGAGSIKFNVLQPLARGLDIYEAGEALKIGELIKLGQWVEAELSTRTDLPLFFHQPAAFRPLSKVFSEDSGGCDFCGIQGILGVLANGTYALCGIGQTVPELVFGQVTTEPLKTVWENSPKLLELRQGLPKLLQGICGKCVMKHLCLGSCIAQTYARHKSFWGPFWFCETAKKLGLFPESRLLPT
jgi:SynChlorMet cassette radical SAM/SPASM protein ScmF